MIVVHYVPNANLAVKWHDERCEDCGVHNVRGGNVVCNHCWDKTHPPLALALVRLAKVESQASSERKCLACGAVLVPKPYELRAGDEKFARRLTCGMACRGKLQSARTKEKGGKLR
jgi:hypothetical protein